jgi:hypothetical protein
MHYPSRQPFVPVDYSATQLPTNDPITKWLYKIGQTAPGVEQRWAMQHGRYLSGLGANETQAPYAAKPDSYTRSLEKDDDVLGSGIFDSYGRQPTVNFELGVFADHPSLPGYIEREVQFSVSKDIADITSGADVVIVPAGGMTYQEKAGYPAPFDRQGPTPCPPHLEFAPAPFREDVYATLSPQAAMAAHYAPGPTFPVGPSAPGQPMPMPPAPPAPQPYPSVQSPMPVTQPLVPQTVIPIGTTYKPAQIPPSPVMMPIGAKSIVNVGTVVQRTPGPLKPAPAAPPMLPSKAVYHPAMMVRRQAAPAPVIPPARAPGPQPILQRAIGDDSTPAGWGTWLVGGAIVGTAAAIMYGTLKMKATPNRRRRRRSRR